MAVRLTRELRFSLTGDPILESDQVTNSWAGWPTAATLAPYLQLRCTVEGDPAPVVGYVCNVKVIDNAVREHALPTAVETYRQSSGRVSAPDLLAAMWQVLVGEMPAEAPLVSLELSVTPMLKFEIVKDRFDMIRVTQQFEFSAAHRLHCHELSDEENRQQFGKCNNANGHGHNYRLDVTVQQPRGESVPAFNLVDLERVVKEQVIDRFDHKHLNEDTEEFKSLNPTVENIAATVWSLLDGKLSPASLDAVRVYETPKTWAECRSGD